MNPKDYVRALHRRWFDIALAVAVALGAGFLISSVAPPGPVTKSYEATSVLLASGNRFATNAPSVEALAALTTVGEVPKRVAQTIGNGDDASALESQVKAEANTAAGLVKITATAANANRATEVANAFARQLIDFVRQLQAEGIAKQTGPMQVQLQRLQNQIEQLDQELTQTSGGNQEVLQAERDAKVRQYGLLYESYQQLALSATNPVELSLIQGATSRQISAGGIQPPRSRTSRLILAGILGLLAGIVLVLVLDRFDQRIRTRQMAETYFKQPVLAEIPFISRRQRRKNPIATLTGSGSGVKSGDAFRTLAVMLSLPRRSTIELMPAGPNGDRGNGHPPLAESYPDVNRAEEPPKTILVTSAGPGDGKTTVVANLAVAMAHRGKRVLVLSCDLRRPKIHRLFGLPNERGLADALEDEEAHGSGMLQSYAQQAKDISRVWVVPSGPPPAHPEELLASPTMRLAVEQAARSADVVLIDSAPLLTTSDAANLVPLSDVVVLVARARRTTGEVAERTVELLARLGAPLAGIALNAVTEMNVPRRYYYYRYYKPQQVKPKKRGRREKPQLAGHSWNG